MNNRKPRLRLLTIPEYRTTHPQFTDAQIRYALRNRATNGLAEHTFRRATGKRDILLDPAAYTAHLTAVVPA
jgi:hypothetical protein